MIEQRRIDFNQLAKPANLQNSAVLRMLEEEETRKRSGQPNLKRVAWPPPPEDQDIDEYIEQGPVQAKTRGIGEYATYQSSPSPQNQNFVPSSPSPVNPGGTLKQPKQFQQEKSAKGWASVSPSATSPLPQPLLQPPTWGQTQKLTPQLQTQSSVDRTRQSPYSTPASTFEAPPSTITLRPEAPISQVPQPVYFSQPAATKAPISGNMRGDQKWPPATVKAQTEAENQARLDLAKGPVCRPRRVNKDYRPFFAQHALTSTYPGYRAPPGTQYFTPGYQN
ncbi:uncharacterized protein LOC117168809 isoform X3 [Belonocnema kinseyi]|uniref:uncharacterized protein LOC117168809 isoform X3 n=1 Tax=Belonocnema kinseyi TaxID=2817044 RepID=UPI00143CCF8B|nr:uncharacterized protein LOC117168809 isoform X3 [Belonocnema kinseyi]